MESDFARFVVTLHRIYSTNFWLEFLAFFMIFLWFVVLTVEIIRQNLKDRKRIANAIVTMTLVPNRLIVDTLVEEART